MQTVGLSQTQLQAVQDVRPPSGFIGSLGQLASQTSRPRKSVKVYESIPTPSEDEEEEEEFAGSGQEFMLREEYYAQAEQQEEDDDPEASIDLEDDHPPTLLHPPIVTQHFAGEEDELFSSPVAPRLLGNLNEGQNLNENYGAIFCSYQQNESIFNGTMVLPHPIRFLLPSDSTLSILQMDACRDPDSPSPLPQQPPQGHKICPIDFSGRKRVEHLQLVFEQAGMQGLPLPSTQPSSAGPPVQQLPSARPMKLGYLWSESPYYHAHSHPSSATSISHSTAHRTSQEHPPMERPTDLGSTTAFATSYPSLAGQLIANGNIQPLKGVAGHSKSPSQPAVPMLQVTAPSPITPVATRNLNQFSFNTSVLSTPAGTYLHPSTAHDEASSIETSDGFEALNDVLMDVPTESGILPDNASEVEDKPSPRSGVEAELSEPHCTGRLQAETVSHIEKAANQIWQVIKKTTKINAAIQPSHIINCAFPTVITHKMLYWNVFLVNNFKESFPNDEWKGILIEYAKVMDLNAGQRTCGKCQSVFKNTFQELAKQDGFEAIMAVVGTNPKDNGPSMVVFHETGLAKGFADQKLHLKNDWATTHLWAYVQNQKSDSVVSLHQQRELQHEQEITSPSGSDIPTSVDGEALLPYEEPPTAMTTVTKDAGKAREIFSTYKLYRPDNAKSAHLSYTVNFSALLEKVSFNGLTVHHDVLICGGDALPITQDGYPDYRSCPWRHLGKSLQEHNMILTGWPPMVPLPINDKMDLMYLNKKAPTGHQDANAYVFVCMAINISTNTYHEGVYCAEIETSHSWTVQAAVPKPAPMDSKQMHTRQNTKNTNKQKDGTDPKLGKKRVAFEEPVNDTDVEPEGQKKRKSHGAKKQNATVVPTQGNIGNIWTAQSQPDKANQGLSENVRECPRPHPAYKQTMTTGQTVMTRQIGAVSGSSALQDSEMDPFYSSPYEFQDLPGSGYIEVNSDDKHLTQTEPVLNHVAWGNAVYANIGWYSGTS
ncbi:uncharacterized protein EV420DRAFT_1726813 [Desarmillaria tabescens]|uniref:Uncharacterized protein n=1 Tax=Armillaria tabescens TaxID=1929756 RepID=A0AA39JK15_ARMTA|nr:uncharacterized protein EV420DRAFT_1726813 [Desarmillaria tabescens]KAK0442764.1 hypothetical protein EV420DRAFT_1726813 [Desarmillaria tabescens]